jgi:hypothetical protein
MNTKTNDELAWQAAYAAHVNQGKNSIPVDQVPNGYKVESIVNDPSGKYAVTFVSNSPDRPNMVAYAGAIFSFSEISETAKDQANALGLISSQFSQKSDDKISNFVESSVNGVTVAGFSLGGGLAQFHGANLAISSQNVQNITTFSSTGMKSDTLSQIDQSRLGDVTITHFERPNDPVNSMFFGTKLNGITKSVSENIHIRTHPGLPYNFVSPHNAKLFDTYVGVGGLTNSTMTKNDSPIADLRDDDPFGGYVSDKENEMWQAETYRDADPFGGGISDKDLADLYTDKATPNPTDSAISSASIMGDLPDGGAPSISEADITDALADFAEAISNMSVDNIEDEWNAGALGGSPHAEEFAGPGGPSSQSGGKASAPSSFGISPGVDPGSLMGNTGRDTLGPSPSTISSPTQNQSHAAAIDVASKSASPEVYSPDLGAAYRTDNPSSPTYGKAPTNQSFTPGNAPSPNDLYGRSAPGSSAAKNTPGSKQDMADIYSYWNMGTPDDMVDVSQNDFAGAMSFGWEDAFGPGIGDAGEQNGNQSGGDKNAGSGSLGA